MIPAFKILGTSYEAAIILQRTGVGHHFALATGCFDLLTRGHVELLNAARKRVTGPLLVGINSDESIRRLKGPKRPVCPLADRLYMLSQLTCVDGVFWFAADTVTSVLSMLGPWYWIKGGDWTMKTLNNAERMAAKRAGTKIVIIPRIGDWSTSSILKKI